LSDTEERLLGRAVHIGRVMAKYGLREHRSDGDVRERARSLRSALEELGPTFAKLGQILSTRPDLLPREFIDELSTLQDQVKPLTEAEVVSVMEEELGVPWEDVFASIEPVPLAAGTIGQVHKATLENGDRVVVKVQRPGASDEIMRDLGLLELFAERTERREALRRVVDVPAVIEHLAESLRRELDFHREAENIHRLREVLESYEHLDVPSVYDELSTARLLVLGFVDGVPVRQAPDVPERRDAARQLIESYYRQILIDGFFHADPHPGNLLWADGNVFFLDCGMVGEIEPRIRDLMLLLVMAFWQEDDSFLAEVVLQLSGDEPPKDLDLAAFEKEIGRLFGDVRGQSLQEIQLGPVMQGITEVAAGHGVRMPASLALTAKALAQMQLAAATLDPELDPFSVVGRFLVKNLASRVRQSIEPKQLFYDVQKIRVRATRFVDSLERMVGARPGGRFQVDLRGTDALEDTIRRAARRVAISVTAGSLMVASGFTATSREVGTWLPILFAAVGGLFLLALLVDLFARRQ